MLSRGSSDASSRLRRAKSASSVQQRRAQPLCGDPIDPQTARLHALVAAHRAMERSSERSSEELKRADSSASRRTTAATPHSQNIRFHTTNELRHQRPLLHSRTSNIASTLRIPQDDVPIDDYASSYGASENYGAEPSSYRRLRKARSLMTPRKQMMSPAPPPAYQTPRNAARSTATSLRQAKSTMFYEGPALKRGLKRSMSFIRSHARSLQRPQSEMAPRKEAVEMAREQFLRAIVDQNQATRSTSSFRPRPNRARTCFPKTVKKSRETESEDGIKSENQSHDAQQAESRIRSISISLREKLKRVFGKSLTQNHEYGIQQIEASRPHFRDYIEDSADAAFDAYHADDPTTTSRGSLYMPTEQYDNTSYHSDKISPTVHSMTGKDSLHSSNQSRVTSWTNSTVTASLAGRATPLEGNRLSVIKEDGGPHQPSSSAGRHLGGVSSFAEPIRRQDSSGRLLAIPDSQRIYSALVRRIDEEEAEMEKTRAQLSAIHQEQNLNGEGGIFRSSTIRMVRSESSLQNVAPDPQHREFSIRSEALREQCMTPQQIARHDAEREKCRANLAAQEFRSSFFPFSNEQKPVTPSPYKVTMAAQRGQKHVFSEDSGEDGRTDTGSVIVHREPRSEKNPHSKFAMSSESLYSRTTNGGSNPLYNSPVVSPAESTEDFGGIGMATIIPSRINRCPRPSASLLQLNRVRSSERGEWKGWMETQMSSLDRCESKASKSTTQTHIREKAQINGDDTSVGSEQAIKLGYGQRNLNETTPTAQSRSNSALNPRFPLLELKEVPRNNTPVPRSSGSVTHSCSGVYNRGSSVEKNDENKKIGARAVRSLRKISPRNIGHLLTETKSQMFGKAGSESPPISTPGRMHVHVAKTRKTDNASASSRNALSEVTPTGNRVRMNQDKVYALGDGKNSQKDLSRLSRPFDMTVPEHNRPFDSMYLGKEEFGTQINHGPGRLSVAPACTATGEKVSQSAEFWKRMSILRKSADEGQDSSPESDTALPRVVSGQIQDQTSKRGHEIGSKSKRMVSNFLRSRRTNNNTTYQHDTDDSVAAFL